MSNGKKKPKILVVGEGFAATGFSRIAHGIIDHLYEEYAFYQFAINHKTDRVEARWPAYGNPDQLDAHGLDRLSDIIKITKPQIILILNDLWFCCIHVQRLVRKKVRPIIVVYCPVDGILTRPELYSALILSNQVVAYNKFGNHELSKIYDIPQTVLSTYGATERIKVIPHGLDTNSFYPFQKSNLSDRREAKRIFFGNDFSENGFIVLNASKHQLRKRIDLTIKGFAQFSKDKPCNVKLYLHTGATFQGPDIRTLAEQEGISDRIITSPGWLKTHPALDEQQLNLLYNASDVGINTSMGEGWGLVSFEHAATGAPQIVPAHSACKELWQNVDTMIPVKKEMEHTGLAMLWGEVDPVDIAKMLNKLYNDEDFKKSQTQKAYDTANQEIYNWDNIAKLWNELFHKLLEAKD
ncbi:MAG: glycosyltransferase [Ferruginibacter sp.]